MWGKSKIASSQPQDERRWNFLLMQIRGFCCCWVKNVFIKKLFRSHEVSLNPSLFVLSAKLPSHDQVCTCQRSLRLKGWIKFNFASCTIPFASNSSKMKIHEFIDDSADDRRHNEPETRQALLFCHSSWIHYFSQHEIFSRISIKFP